MSADSRLQDIERLPASFSSRSRAVLVCEARRLEEEPGAFESARSSRFVDSAGFQGASDFATRVDAIHAKYKTQRRRDATGEAILKANRAVIMGVVDTVSSAAVVYGPAGVVAAKAVRFGMDQLLGFTVEKYKENADRRVKSLLGDHFAALAGDHAADLEGYFQRPTEEVKALIFGHDKGIFAQESYLALSDEEKGIARDYMIQTLETTMAHHLANHDGRLSYMEFRDQVQQYQIDAHENKLNTVVSTVRVLAEFQVEAGRRLDVVESNLGAVREGVLRLRDGLEETTSQVRLGHEFMFSNLSPDQQLAALDRGLMSHMHPDDEAALKEQVALRKQQKDFVESVGNFIHGAQILRGIAGHLELDADIVEAIDFSIQAGDTGLKVYQAATNMTTGNVLTAVGAVAGLFMGGGEDAATVRHRQVMGALTGMIKNQRVILDNQRRLFEGQRQIIQNQAEMFKLIQNVGSQVVAARDQILDRLYDIEGEVLENRLLLQSLVEHDQNVLKSFLETRDDDEAFDFADGSFRSFQGMRVHFETFSDQFEEGFLGLDAQVRRPDTVDPLFRIEISEADEDRLPQQAQGDIDALKERLAANTALFQVVAAERGLSLDKALLLWRFPSVQLSSLRLRADAVKVASPLTVDEDHRLRERLDYLGDNLAAPMDPARVIDVASMLLEVHHYPQFLDGLEDNRMMSFSQVLEERPSGLRGKILLGRLEWLLELSVAQAALDGGDLVLPHVEQEFHDLVRGVADATLLHSRLFTCLAKNPVMRRNLLVLAVRRALAAAGHNAFSYSVAWQHASGHGLFNEVLGEEWNVEWRDPVEGQAGRWWLTIPELGDNPALRIPMPVPETVAQPTIVYGPEVSDLLDMLRRVGDERFEYDFAQTLTADDREFFARLPIYAA